MASMNSNVVVVYKNCGETPLECLTRVKNDHPEWKHLPVTYAGRLDPMAEGVLLVLAGDECLKKDEYLALSKEYEVTVLFGFATDTYDLLGKIEFDSSSPAKGRWLKAGEVNTPSASGISPFAGGEEIQNTLPNFIGRINQAYPPYSSRTVDGKPLFQWAREGRLGEITIPSHDVFVENIEIVKTNSITKNDIEKRLHDTIPLVTGDFRQAEIMHLWKETLSQYPDAIFQTVTLKISCGSGVYVRSITHDLGMTLGTHALAFKIVRTKVGEYEIQK